MLDQRLEKGKQTKESIIKASLVIIGEEGIKNLSANKIAKLAQISKSTVFHHYESIDLIPMACLNFLIEDMVSSIEIKEGDSVRDLLIRIGTYTFDVPPEEKKLYRALFNLFSEAFFNEAYKDAIEGMREQYAAALKQSILEVSNTNYDMSQLEQLCRVMTMTIDCYGYHSLSSKDVSHYPALWAMSVDMFVSKLNSLVIE
ncbi:MAG: TetR/AcrR family transcriptional regulator [Clostridia bacterium]|nr:TetR/AcrR family transcriptional regulator [Clostridia bacterium]